MTMTPELGTGGKAAVAMPVIHRIFRAALREVRRLVPQVSPAAPDRVRAVADHLAFTLDGLHYHHSTEDELIWPLLADRAGPDAPLVARMEEQHQAVDEAVGRVRETAAAWVETPGRRTGDALTAALGDLLDVLELHLDEEERDVVPLIDAYLTVEEFEEMGRESFAKFAPRQRVIAMGQSLEVATEDEVREMFADLPVFVRVFWAVVGKRQYRKRMAAVRGKPLNSVLRRAMRIANPTAVRMYRRSGGRRGGTAKGFPVLLITVRGRRTGVEHTTPIAYFEGEGGYLVFGSGAGFEPEPQWFRNLRRVERAAVQIGADTRSVRVRIAGPDERERLWHDLVARAPVLTTYEKRSGRVIPIAVLTPV